MFYNIVYLCDSRNYTNKYSGVTGQLVAPDIKDVKREWERFEKDTGIKAKLHNLFFTVDTNDDQTSTTILLEATYTYSSEDFIKNLHLSSATINTVMNNCGTIQITNVTNNGYPQGWAHFLVEEIIRWAKYAGYTNIIGNTAGQYQNKKALPWFKKKFGAVEWGPPYINKRSGNTNVWFQIPLVDQDSLHVISDDEPEDYDEDEDEDMLTNRED